ncbi:MAG: hypothetical protein AB7K52_02730 [Phycisphaerales bacterium]
MTAHALLSAPAPTPVGTLPDSHLPDFLHVIDPFTAGEGALLAAAVATRSSHARHRAWILGSSSDLRHARRAGLPDPVGVTFSLGAPMTALRSIWRLRQALPAPPETIIAWSPLSLSLALAAWRSPVAPRAPISFVGIMPVGPAAAGRGFLARRRLALALRRATIVPLGDALQSAWSAAVGVGVTALPTPVAPLGISPDSRRALRDELRIAPDELAVLLLSDPPSHADGRHFTQSIGMARLCDLPVVGMMHRDVPDWPRALTFVRTHCHEWDMLRIDGPLSLALHAADLCVWDPADRPGSPGASAQGPVLALAAAAAGIPVVAPDSPISREILAPVADSCLAPGWQERQIAGRLTALVDPAVRAAIADRLRAHHALRLRAFHERLAETLRIVRGSALSAAAWRDAIELGNLA